MSTETQKQTETNTAGQSALIETLGYEITTKYTGYKATCRDLVKKLSDSGGDIHCMGTYEFIDPNYPNETCAFEEGWAWIQDRPGSKLLIVVEEVSCVGKVT